MQYVFCGLQITELCLNVNHNTQITQSTLRQQKKHLITAVLTENRHFLTPFLLKSPCNNDQAGSLGDYAILPGPPKIDPEYIYIFRYTYMYLYVYIYVCRHCPSLALLSPGRVNHGCLPQVRRTRCTLIDPDIYKSPVYCTIQLTLEFPQQQNLLKIYKQISLSN